MGAHSGFTLRWDTTGKLLSRCVTKKISNDFCSQKKLSEALKIVPVWRRFATPNVTRMEPCKNPQHWPKCSRLTWLINTMGRVVVTVDVTPGVLEVEQRQPVLHRCSLHEIGELVDRQVVERF